MPVDDALPAFAIKLRPQMNERSRSFLLLNRLHPYAALAAVIVPRCRLGERRLREIIHAEDELGGSCLVLLWAVSNFRA